MRPRILVGLVPLLALVLAGCLTTSEPLAATGLVPGVASRFLPPVAMNQDAFGAEPNIAVLPDGTLFIASVAGNAGKPNALDGAGWLWRSQDGGATWDTLRRPGTLPVFAFCSCDTDVVGAADGWVYYTDWWLPVAVVPGVTAVAPVGNYLVERSSDGGATWQQSPITIPLLDGQSIDRQWLAADGNGTVLLAYAFYHPLQNQIMALQDFPLGRGPLLQSIQVARSTDHGATWQDPATALPTVPGTFYLHAKPALMPDSSFAMAFGETPVDYLKGPGRVGVAFSDEGRTWHTRYVADVPEGFESVWPVQAAADATGALHVVWNARTGDTITLFHSATSDKGATWTAPAAIRAAGTNVLPWVAARGAGDVAVGWYGGDATGDPSKAPDNAPWYAYVAERHGDAAWAIGKVSDEPVKTGPFCPLGSACGGNRELLDYVSLIHDPAGRVHFAYAHSEQEGQGDTARVLYTGTVPAAEP